MGGETQLENEHIVKDFEFHVAPFTRSCPASARDVPALAWSFVSPHQVTMQKHNERTPALSFIEARSQCVGGPARARFPFVFPALFLSRRDETLAQRGV